MGIQLNHIIVPARDKQASAKFLAELLGLPEPTPFGPFVGVQADNGVTLDFADGGDEISSRHYAFLVTEHEFDEVFARVRERGLTFYADPHHHEPGKINHWNGGRGFYFDDPNGHNLELLTQPYGSTH